MRSEPRSRAFSTPHRNARLKKVSSSTVVETNMQLVGIIFCSAGACTMHFFELRIPPYIVDCVWNFSKKFSWISWNNAYIDTFLRNVETLWIGRVCIYHARRHCHMCLFYKDISPHTVYNSQVLSSRKRTSEQHPAFFPFIKSNLGDVPFSSKIVTLRR